MPPVAAGAIIAGSAITAGGSIASTILGGKSARGASRRAAEMEADAASRQLEFLREQAAEDRRRWEETEGRRRQEWDVTEGQRRREWEGSEARLTPYRNLGGQSAIMLGHLLGVGDVSGGWGPESASAARMSAMSPVDPVTQQHIWSLLGDQAPTSATLQGLEDPFKAQGIKVMRNAEGRSQKIQLPDGRIIDLIENENSPGARWQWIDESQGGGGGVPMRRLLSSRMPPASMPMRDLLVRTPPLGPSGIRPMPENYTMMADLLARYRRA